MSRTVPGLYFVGLPFQTSFASATLRGVGSDAELVVARARRQVAVGDGASGASRLRHAAAARPRGGPSFGESGAAG